MIDLHSHLLPGIDDGSRSVTQSVEVLRHFAESGITDVVLTPHIKASGIRDYGDDLLALRREAYETLSAEAPAPGGVRLHLGFEIMLDDLLSPRTVEDRSYSLAGSRYYLVEFLPSVAVDGAAKVLTDLADRDIVPLVAHPERYNRLSVTAASAWVKSGARLQVDATTLTQATSRGKRARSLVAAGLASVVAADNHGGSRSLVTAVRYLEERGCGQVVERLTRINPQAVLDDADMEDVPRVELPERWVDNVRSFLGV